MNRNKAAEILGVFPDVSEEELKKRYRALLLMTHPDAVKQHDYPYEATEIIEAYEYLSSHLTDYKRHEKAQMRRKTSWSAPINPNAFIERPIYQYYENNEGERLGIVTVDTGKYMWIQDEDYSLFLKSLYVAAKQIISNDDEKKNLSRTEDVKLLGDITYLLAGQFFGTDMALGLMNEVEEGIYYSKAMLELTEVKKKPKDGGVLVPAKVRNHRLYVNDNKGNELGYISFKDDRLLFGIVPLFERKSVQLKMRACESRRRDRSVDVDFWLKVIPENSAIIDSVNIKIDQMLNNE